MLKNAIKEQSDNLHADPDFVKVMKTARRKCCKRRRIVPMHQREIVALIVYIQRLEQILK
jgi:cytochrome c oxidase cbb3-type subunit I/II